ncbi:hypothetical protein YPPY66_1690 [Yersinia pestis PY-66]|nr:hypothetical protein YPPY66_1690 [Yersinia pestis PY-66]
MTGKWPTTHTVHNPCQIPSMSNTIHIEYHPAWALAIFYDTVL